MRNVERVAPLVVVLAVVGCASTGPTLLIDPIFAEFLETPCTGEAGGYPVEMVFHANGMVDFNPDANKKFGWRTQHRPVQANNVAGTISFNGEQGSTFDMQIRPGKKMTGVFANGFQIGQVSLTCGRAADG